MQKYCWKVEVCA